MIDSIGFSEGGRVAEPRDVSPGCRTNAAPSPSALPPLTSSAARSPQYLSSSSAAEGSLPPGCQARASAPATMMFAARARGPSSDATPERAAPRAAPVAIKPVSARCRCTDGTVPQAAEVARERGSTESTRAALEGGPRLEATERALPKRIEGAVRKRPLAGRLATSTRLSIISGPGAVAPSRWGAASTAETLAAVLGIAAADSSSGGARTAGPYALKSASVTWAGGRASGLYLHAPAFALAHAT
jgi:hypothetical protein